MKKILSALLCALSTLLLTCPVWAVAPPTGDNSNIPLMIALVVISLIAIVVLVVLAAKNKKK